MEGHAPIPVLVNGSAGSARGGVAALTERLEAAGVPASVREVAPAQVAAEVAAAVAAGARIVAVAGGDGSLSAAAGVLAGTGVALAPIPLGTLNHFARRLQLPDVDAAVHALAAGRRLRVAVGRADGRVFINNASCGAYPHLVRHRERLRRWLGKWPAAAVAGVQVLLGLRRLRVTLETARAELHREVAAVWVGLGRGSFQLPGEAPLAKDARELEIVLPHAESRAGLLRLGARVLWRLARGERPRTAGLELVHVSAFELAARHPIDVALDGEPMRLPAPIPFRLERAALEVIVAPELDVKA